MAAAGGGSGGGASGSGGSATAFGLAAREMVTELHRSEYLTQFNDDAVRRVTEEISALFDEVSTVIRAVGTRLTDPATVCGLSVQHASANRNKRCLLAYMEERTKRIERLRWEYGAVPPGHWYARFSRPEVDYLRNYNSLLTEYMRAIGGLDLAVDLEPPRDLFVQVRVLQELGEVELPSGPVTLSKDHILLLRRTDVESFVRQGLLEEVLSDD